MRVVLDVEATGAQRNHAHPFDYRNVACNLGLYNIDTGELKIWKIQYDDDPYGDSLKEIQTWLDQATLLVGFNLKYDLHWLFRYKLSYSQRLFDCQVAYFILRNQQNSYPALNNVALELGVEQKLDVVKTEYWDKGLDTNQVPYEILSEYLEQDLRTTAQVFLKLQCEIDRVSRDMTTCIRMAMLDLGILADIEQNGLLYDTDKSLQKGEELVKKIDEIDLWIRNTFNVPWFNPNSGEHTSVLLYGGTIMLDGQESYLFTYKDGREVIKTRKAKIPQTYAGMYKPLEGSELAKDGFYATNEPTLVSIKNSAKKGTTELIDVLLHRSKLEKLRSTYYQGLPKRILEMGWGDNIIHSSFNQCVAVSGRLSSTKPNVQNVAGEVKEVFISRF